MKIGIVGYGFVGKAIENGFNTENVDLYITDPKLGNNFSDLEKFNPNVIFICVPTPMKENMSQDISIVKEIIDNIKNSTLNSYVVLKSTVLPLHINEIESILDKFIYNPEFLREAHANDDFIKSDLIVFGGKKEHCDHIAKIYTKYSKCISNDFVKTEAVSAAFIKYTINSFLATKVIYFNELYNVFIKYRTSNEWESFIKALSKDKRIGSSHMQVPGHDGRYGFGGACLPKDSNAFYQFSETINEPMELLSKVIELNNNIRSKYNKSTERELEQNINFNKEKE